MLRALGAAASAPLVAPLLSACGGKPPVARAGEGFPARSIDGIRAQLRDLVAELARRHPDASALATLRSRGGAAFDGIARDADAGRSAAVVLGVGSGGVRLEEATSDVSAWGLRQATDRLLARAGAGSPRPAIGFGAPRDLPAAVRGDPAALTPQQWLDQVVALHERARRVGGSRIVYRGAYLTVDDVDRIYLAEDRDLTQRLVRCRAGVLLVAWTGSEPTAEDASHAGTIGLEALEVPGDELEAAADRALAALTARSLDAADGDIILDPTCSAMLARRALAPALDAAAWLSGSSRAAAERALGAAPITLIDDATLAGGFGSYAFDDEGTAAARTVLVDGGNVAAPYSDRASAAALRVAATGNGRRPTPLQPVRPAPSNLQLAGGTPTAEQLVGDVSRGLSIEGAVAVEIDLRSWRFALRAARARGIEGGKPSGALYRAVDLRGDLRGLLGAIRGASAELGSYAVTDGGVAMSAAGPHLLGRAEVRGA